MLCCFIAYRCYLDTVEKYIPPVKEEPQLKKLLNAIRDKISELVTESSTTEISAMSCEGSLSGAISDVCHVACYTFSL